MDTPIRIDGSYGEGGGQVLRTSLALAALTQRPLALFNIRAGRQKPGLAAQHLTGVNAVAQITQGVLASAELGSLELSLTPRRRRGGKYVFDVSSVRASAGATGLVAQTILPPLLFCEEPSQVILRGGTHVAWSPHFHYLAEVFLPTLAQMGGPVKARLERAGWYPEGGGEIVLDIAPVKRLRPLTLTERGEVRIRGLSALSNLPEHILTRQVQGAEKTLRAADWSATFKTATLPSPSRGTVVFLVAESKTARAGFTALGQRGKPAERVGEEAAELLLHHLRRPGALEEHLADQLILYLALAEGRSTLTTSCLSQHLLTNIWVVEQFLPVRFEVEGEEGEPGTVSVEGVGYAP